MMFSVHGGEEVSGGFMAGFLLPAAPVQEVAVAETAEHPDDPHRVRQAHASLVIAVRDVQALVQDAFDAPGRAVALQPLRGPNSAGGRLVISATVFRGLLAQQGEFARRGENYRLGAGRAGAQEARFGLAFAELTSAHQRSCGRARGKIRLRARARARAIGSS